MSNLAKCDSVKLRLYAREVEERFCKVYRNVIYNFFNFKKDLISDAKLMLNSKKGRKKVNSDLPSYQLGFLLSFGVQDTCLSARKFFESIVNDPKMIQKLSKNRRIKLFCLESESLPTVIGVCQVINEIIKEFGPRGKFYFTEIRIVVIDNRENWKRLCGCVIDTANSYFTKVELKLDSVEDFMSWSFQEFNEKIRELDFLVIARFFAEDRNFNYNLIRIVLNEMKEDAILFYFDSCNEKFYTNLKEISKAHSFSQVKNCQNLLASFEDLGDEQYYLDLPVSWDKDFQPVMFSTWIKDAVQNNSFQEVVKPIASKELNSNSFEEKFNNLEMLSLNKHVSNSKITETSISGQTNVVIGKKKVKSSAEKRSESDTLPGQTKVVTGKKKINHVAEQCNDFDSLSEQKNLINGKEKVKPSKKHLAQSNRLKRQTKVKKQSETQKSYEMIGSIINILQQQMLDSRTANSSNTSQCSNVPCDAAISQKVTAKAGNQVNSVKCCETYTTQNINPKEKTKGATSKIFTSTSKTITSNIGDQILITKETGNGKVSSFVSKTNGSQTKNETESSKKSTKNSAHVKEEFKTKSLKNKSPNTAIPKVQTEKSVESNSLKKTRKKSAQTKKANKSNATEKIKLSGKFARMDLEKKNKDERHKMRAKKASFAKHANFDYDD